MVRCTWDRPAVQADEQAPHPSAGPRRRPGTQLRSLYSHRRRAVFPEAVCQMLASAGVSAAAIADERSRMSQMAFGPTRSRSLLGTLNDFSFGVRVHFMTARDESLEDIARALARTPIMPLGGARPIDLTRGIFEDG